MKFYFTFSFLFKIDFFHTSLDKEILLLKTYGIFFNQREWMLSENLRPKFCFKESTFKSWNRLKYKEIFLKFFQILIEMSFYGLSSSLLRDLNIKFITYIKHFGYWFLCNSCGRKVLLTLKPIICLFNLFNLEFPEILNNLFQQLASVKTIA